MKIPDSWTGASLADLVDPKRRITYGVVKPGEPEDPGVIMIRSQDYSNGWGRTDDLLRIARDLDATYARSRVMEGDILVTLVGANVGAIVRVPSALDGANISRAVARVAVTSEDCNTEFVFQYLTSPIGQVELLRNSKGGAQAVLNLSDLDVVQVPLPPLAEQRCIAEILSTWDAAIENTEKLLDAKQRRKRALAQQLLTGKRRFREFGGQWMPTKFGAFLTESREAGSDGARARKISVKLYGLGVVPKSDIREGSENTKYYHRRAGHFIYSKLDFLNGAFGLVPEALDGWESTLDLPCFDVDRSIVEPDWLLPYVVREEFYTNCLGLAMGGRKARRVPPEEFLAMHIKLPSLAEQQKIAAVLNTADAEIVQLKDQLAALKKQKQGLMQVLLTGRVRVAT